MLSYVYAAGAGEAAEHACLPAQIKLANDTIKLATISNIWFMCSVDMVYLV